MAGQSANHRDLLDFVRSIDGRGARPDAVEVQQRLEEAEPMFQNVLRYKVRALSQVNSIYVPQSASCTIAVETRYHCRAILQNQGST